jgi:hypothetical protein
MYMEYNSIPRPLLYNTCHSIDNLEHYLLSVFSNVFMNSKLSIEWQELNIYIVE